MKEIQPLQIPNILLKKNMFQNKDTFESKCIVFFYLNKKYLIKNKVDFIKFKGNQFIQVDPPILKFIGFDINKINSLKLKVINKAEVSQRIHVLPLDSDSFDFKMNKKGLVAPGMSEEITIILKPEEHKYYFTTLRINSQTENILVPIHAYPVIDRENIRNLFPRLIDFGVIEIGESRTIINFLECKIPINFEFEFEFLKENTEMFIQPMKGIIPAQGKIEINLIYKPSSNTTAISEVELKISQFDFEPLKIKLLGSGKYKDPSYQKKKKTQKLEKLTLSLNNYSQIQQNNYSQIQQNNYSQIQQNNSVFNNEKEQIHLQFAQKNIENYQKNMSQTFIKKEKKNEQSQEEQEYQEIQQSKSPRNQKEWLFIEKCSQISLMDKYKQIKFFQCIGDRQIQMYEIEGIKDERTQYIQQKYYQIEIEGIHRHDKKINQDQPILDQKIEQLQPTWDYDKNDTLKLRKNKLNNFVNAVTRVVLKQRMEKVLQKIKIWLNNASTKEEVKIMVNQETQKADYLGQGKKILLVFLQIQIIKFPKYYFQFNTNLQIGNQNLNLILR
ncbi:hypothetical protein IMG5_117990 [Ichthyophthirius multifiliis]|uniref:MSP domain-containing protein n=1 Tax=Ichthyophthirius multifiliis TaxID=5932 RepID=G0QUM8_ICHMU|nr:hypothetical protein IMG5_117990 [Ichthyophthirius multifiliis]EGR31074.1 hypothetical protein IMG5_117990 [Ichthyophthirius multifiliis]|eukprot:XP_004034560.1 hypothetical protein IMG5_117990 [Ichthyophthirius multifiliis]